MENLSQVKSRPSAKDRWIAFGYTTIFSFGISGLLYLLGFAEPYGSVLIISLCIGWSIHFCTALGTEWFSRYLPVYLSVVLLTGLGLLVGLLLAGTVITGSPSYFLRDSYVTLIIGVFFGAVGMVIFTTRAQLVNTEAELARVEGEKHAQDKLLLETELKLLQAQIEPHFLFNTLSNVVGLIHTDPDSAEKTLLNLTTLLRSSLQRTRESSITLAEEFEIVRAYLEIQAMRMGARLSFSISPADTDENFELLHWPLAPLLVQPLVENAIKHGIDPDENGGEINVEASVDEKKLIIKISDTGVGFGGGSQSGTGTGLTNVRQRLTALYGPDASMTINENKPSGIEVILIIPAQEPQR